MKTATPRLSGRMQSQDAVALGLVYAHCVEIATTTALDTSKHPAAGLGEQ